MPVGQAINTVIGKMNQTIHQSCQFPYDFSVKVNLKDKRQTFMKCRLYYLTHWVINIRIAK